MYRKDRNDYLQSKNTYIISSPYQQFYLSKKKFYGTVNKQLKKSLTVVEQAKAKNSKDFKKKKSNSTYKTESIVRQSSDYPFHQSSYEFNKTDYSMERQSKTSNCYNFETEKKKSLKVKNKRAASEQRHKKEGSNFDKLKIKDIDELIVFIDKCVKEANEYIGFLSQKIDNLKVQLSEAKKLQEMTEFTLKEKNVQIQRLSQVKIKDKNVDHPFQIKTLLEVVGKLNDENLLLKKELEELRKKPAQPILPSCLEKMEKQEHFVKFEENSSPKPFFLNSKQT